MKVIQIFKYLFVSMLSLNLVQMPAIYGEVSNQECTPKALKVPFPENFVRESLKKYSVPENSWNSIIEALNEKGKRVVKIVETKAAKMTPNPLGNPKQGLVIVKLFKETLLEVSIDTFKQNGVNNLTQVQAILDDIQEQKRQQFTECINQRKIPILRDLKGDIQEGRSQSPIEEQS